MAEFSVTAEDELSPPLRLDRYVSEKLCLLSRSQIKAKKLKAKINGKEAKLSRPVKQGDFLELCWDDSPPEDIIPQDIPLDIVYEDENCIVINKAQGMVVHPAAGNRESTLANALFFMMLEKKGKAEFADNVRPGIVHRLDKETSGIIIAAFNEEAHAFLAEQFKSRKVKKSYIAVCRGAPKESKGKIETFIARDQKDRKRFAVSVKGKTAVTYYKVLKSWKNYSLLLLRPRTGRTHQLRVHMRHINCPILGDPLYSKNGTQFPKASLMLHARSLAITLPGEKEPRIFSSPVPERFLEVIKKLNKAGGADG